MEKIFLKKIWKGYYSQNYLFSVPALWLFGKMPCDSLPCFWAPNILEIANVKWWQSGPSSHGNLGVREACGRMEGENYRDKQKEVKKLVKPLSSSIIVNI